MHLLRTGKWAGHAHSPQELPEMMGYNNLLLAIKPAHGRVSFYLGDSFFHVYRPISFTFCYPS
jgi:hypothetical protein